MKKLLGRLSGSRSKMAKKHECCGKVYVGNASWQAHKRNHRLKGEII